jgi:hypothetical protein
MSSHRTAQFLAIAACGGILLSPAASGVAENLVSEVRNLETQSELEQTLQAFLTSRSIYVHSGKTLIILRGYGLNAQPLAGGNQIFPPQWNDAFFLVQPDVEGKLRVLFSAMGTADPNTAIEPHEDHKPYGGWLRIKAGWYPETWVSDGQLLLQTGSIEVEGLTREGRPGKSFFWDNGSPEEPGSFIGHPPMVFETPPPIGEAVSSQGCLVLKRRTDWDSMMQIIGKNKVVQVGIFE